MIFNKKLAVAVSGAVLLMAGQFALADSTTDIVDALVSKGVLTEEEGKLIAKGHVGEKKAQDKAIKGKLSISNAVDSGTLYGDIRARYEYRDNTALGNDYEFNRARLKASIGFKLNDPTKDKWYADFALSSGGDGRSDNWNMGTATFSSTKSTVNTKAGVNFKRVAFGWNPTEWLNLEVGRQANPLYTTPMVWDADLTPDALVERLKFKTNGGTEIFVTGMQMEYLGARLTTNGGIPSDTVPSTSNGTTELLATQAGFKMPITDASSLKAAATYTTYTRGLDRNSFSNTVFYGINNLSTIEVPAEFNYFLSSGIGIRAYGDYVYNTDANKRASNFAVGTSSGSDDYSWLLGIKVASAKDLKAFEGNKASAGDWSAALWYQETGLFSIDPNLVDSDFFDSRINMKGAIFKAQYNLEDNVAINFSYGHGERLNKKYNAVGSGDMGFSDAMGNFDLLQTDVTYKF